MRFDIFFIIDLVEYIEAWGETVASQLECQSIFIPIFLFLPLHILQKILYIWIPLDFHIIEKCNSMITLFKSLSTIRLQF